MVILTRPERRCHYYYHFHWRVTNFRRPRFEKLDVKPSRSQTFHCLLLLLALMDPAIYRATVYFVSVRYQP